MIDSIAQFFSEYFLFVLLAFAVFVFVVQQILMELHIRKLIKEYGSFDKIPPEKLLAHHDEMY